MENTEILKLREKIAKDAEQSNRRISSLQSDVQLLVAKRKEEKSKWEQIDADLEQNINAAINEISEIQGRLLSAEELIRHLEQEN